MRARDHVRRHVRPWFAGSTSFFAWIPLLLGRAVEPRLLAFGLPILGAAIVAYRRAGRSAHAGVDPRAIEAELIARGVPKDEHRAILARLE